MKYLDQRRIQRTQALLTNEERQLKMEISLEASGNIEQNQPAACAKSEELTCAE